MSQEIESASSPEEAKKPSTFRFVDYRVYQDSKRWFQEVLSLKGLLESTPELWNQLKANVMSVVMNITSSSTKLPLEARRYLGFSITSANKAVACLDMACDLKILTPEEFQTLSHGFQGVIIQLKGFIKALGVHIKARAESEKSSVLPA
mgnify:CR=1 FL=1